MKAIPPLLSCLLIASVAVLNSGAAWSGNVQAGEGLAKPSAGTTHKQAKKPLRKAKTAQKKARKYHSQAKPIAQARVSEAPPAVAENAYLPSSTAPVVAKANIYLPAAAAPSPIAAITPPAAASAPSTDAAKEVPATPAAAPLTLAKSLALASAPASAPAETQAAQAGNPWNAKAEATVRPQLQKADSIIARPAGNPYLAYNAAYNQPFTTFNPAESISQLFSGLMFALPALSPSDQSYKLAFNSAATATNTTAGLGQLFNSLRDYLPEPHLPSADIDILPSITKVYPTGEKPLVVLTFKCPTELIGITPLPTKALRWLITAGMDTINSTNLLSFNMQQVCQ